MDVCIRRLLAGVLGSARVDERQPDMNALFLIMNGLLSNLQIRDVEDGVLGSRRVVARTVAEISNMGSGGGHCSDCIVDFLVGGVSETCL